MIPAPGKNGTWIYNFRNDGYDKEFKMTATENALFKQKLSTIAESLRQMPVLVKPLGFDPFVYSRVFYPFNYSWHKQYFGIVGELVIEFRGWYKFQGKEVRQNIEPPACRVMINDARSTVSLEYLNYRPDGYIEEVDRIASALNDFFSLPRKVKDLAAGVSLYDNDIIVIATEKKPFWIPVTLKEYYTLSLRYYELLSIKDPGNKIVYDIFKKDHEALSPEQLKGPAFRNINPDIISEVSAVPNAMPLMKFNPDYFNRNRPRTDVQLITIANSSASLLSKDESEISPKDLTHLRLYQFMHAVDTTKLKGLLDVK